MTKYDLIPMQYEVYNVLTAINALNENDYNLLQQPGCENLSKIKLDIEGNYFSIKEMVKIASDKIEQIISIIENLEREVEK